MDKGRNCWLLNDIFLSKNIRSVLEKHANGREILEDLDRGMLRRKLGIKMVQIIVTHD